MAMTLRLTKAEHESLRRRSELDGISMQEAARQAVREFVTRRDHQDKVDAVAKLVASNHADALTRLGRPGRPGQ